MDLNTISILQNLIRKRIERCKQAAIYSVDTIEELQYVRGQIK